MRRSRMRSGSIGEPSPRSMPRKGKELFANRAGVISSGIYVPELASSRTAGSSGMGRARSAKAIKAIRSGSTLDDPALRALLDSVTLVETSCGELLGEARALLVSMEPMCVQSLRTSEVLLRHHQCDRMARPGQNDNALRYHACMASIMQGSDGLDGRGVVSADGVGDKDGAVGAKPTNESRSRPASSGFQRFMEDVEQSVLEPLSLQLRAIGSLRDKLVEREDLKAVYEKTVKAANKLRRTSRTSPSKLLSSGMSASSMKQQQRKHDAEAAERDAHQRLRECSDTILLSCQGIAARRIEAVWLPAQALARAQLRFFSEATSWLRLVQPIPNIENKNHNAEDSTSKNYERRQSFDKELLKRHPPPTRGATVVSVDSEDDGDPARYGNVSRFAAALHRVSSTLPPVNVKVFQQEMLARRLARESREEHNCQNAERQRRLHGTSSTSKSSPPRPKGSPTTYSSPLPESTSGKSSKTPSILSSSQPVPNQKRSYPKESKKSSKSGVAMGPIVPTFEPELNDEHISMSTQGSGVGGLALFGPVISDPNPSLATKPSTKMAQMWASRRNAESDESDSEAEDIEGEDNSGADPDALRMAATGLLDAGILSAEQVEGILKLLRRGRIQRASVKLSNLIEESSNAKVSIEMTTAQGISSSRQTDSQHDERPNTVAKTLSTDRGLSSSDEDLPGSQGNAFCENGQIVMIVSDDVVTSQPKPEIIVTKKSKRTKKEKKDKQDRNREKKGSTKKHKKRKSKKARKKKGDALKAEADAHEMRKAGGSDGETEEAFGEFGSTFDQFRSVEDKSINVLGDGKEDTELNQHDEKSHETNLNYEVTSESTPRNLKVDFDVPSAAKTITEEVKSENSLNLVLEPAEEEKSEKSSSKDFSTCAEMAEVVACSIASLPSEIQVREEYINISQVKEFFRLCNLHLQRPDDSEKRAKKMVKAVKKMKGKKEEDEKPNCIEAIDIKNWLLERFEVKNPAVLRSFYEVSLNISASMEDIPG